MLSIYLSRAEIKVSEVLELLKKYKEYFYGSGMVPAIKSSFERDLYNTFITYMDAG